MTKPTKAHMLETREKVLGALSVVRQHVPRTVTPEFDQAWLEIETFIAVAMRVLAKANTSKLRTETITVERAARLAGRVVFDPTD